MLRCRRCRKGVLDSTSMSKVEASDESSAAVCTIWHLNIDTLPDWILTSVHQAQWTVGKLNCQNCAARLGGFNFINRSSCPCGQDATVHLSKSRVDCDYKQHVFIVQPRRMRPRKEQASLLMDGSQCQEERTRSLQLNCAAVMSHSSPEDAFNSQGTTGKPATEMMRAEMDESTRLHVSYPASQQFDTVDGASVSAVSCHSFISGRTRSPLHQQLLQTVEDVQSSVETPASQQQVSDSEPLIRGGSISDSEPEQDQEVPPHVLTASSASPTLSKRERNRLKGLRRKQRRRERWLRSQQEQKEAESVFSSLLDSDEEDREGFTCAVCLDIYFSPHRCQPCGHIFCEPCLRTIAKNRPATTPCPLCRSLVSCTSFHKELDQTTKTLFPKVYFDRKQNFQSASCAKWPLPSCRKRFGNLWGEQRRPMMMGRRWHFAHTGFTLHTLDLTDMRGWLFDIGLVIVYIHSVNWILVLLFLCFLMYYFLF